MAVRNSSLDSGYLANTQSTTAVVFRKDITIPDAYWLRLHFGTTNLPAGSSLRLTGAKDGAVQRLDGASLRDYGYTSAYFNGSGVRVELLAAPGSHGNRVSVHQVALDSIDAPRNDTICGNTDDRVLSADPRIGRAVTGASACTWWLISECAMVTAGHCASGASAPVIVGFNLPLSLPNGTMVHPPPDDQYPAIVSTLQYENAGRGSDWAVIRMARNSNHGRYPGEQQGAWFDIGAVPSSTSGVSIRITGNGRVTAPVSLTWSSVTKTHVGPRLSTTIADALRYETDTTGGNSGSPVIHDQTGLAIGVHTHGGCNATGGGNYGTRVDKVNFASALTNALGLSCGTFRLFGQGCAGAGGVPQLTMSGTPDVGSTAIADLANLPVNQFGAVVYGFSDAVYQSTSLPLLLDSFGFVGCTLYAAPEITVYVPSANGSNSHNLAIPNHPMAIGVDLYLQYFVAEPTAAGGAVLSNAARVHIGA